MKRTLFGIALITLIAISGMFFLSGCAKKASKPPVTSGPGIAGVVYPSSWHMYALNPGHAATFNKSGEKAAAVSWKFGVKNAIPLSMPVSEIKKKYVGITNVRDLIGIPIGVAVVKGVVFAPNDNGYVYAINAANGQLIWKANVLNQIMSTPIVANTPKGELVYVGGGNSVFAYSHAVKFGVPGAQVIRGVDVSGVYALNAKNGRLVWAYHTKGEDMPTGIYYKNKFIFGNGDGHIYALDAAAGKLLWRVYIKSFVSMSSAVRYHNFIIMGGTHPNYLYAVNANTGKLAWKVMPPKVFSSSMGDGSPAVSVKNGIVVIQIERKAPGVYRSSSVEIGLNAKNGKILWSTNLGEGIVPPRNKDAVPMIYKGVIYTGSPVTATAYALDVKTGRILWRTPLHVRMKAAPSIQGQDLFFPVGNGKIFVVNKANGKIIHIYVSGNGGFGPQNAVIVDHTMFIGSNFGWVYAIPTSKIVG